MWALYLQPDCNRNVLYTQVLATCNSKSEALDILVDLIGEVCRVEYDDDDTVYKYVTADYNTIYDINRVLELNLLPARATRTFFVIKEVKNARELIEYKRELMNDCIY